MPMKWKLILTKNISTDQEILIEEVVFKRDLEGWNEILKWGNGKGPFMFIPYSAKS